MNLICAICYKKDVAICIDVSLCRTHAEEYEFGYGKTIKQMLKEHKKPLKENELP